MSSPLLFLRSRAGDAVQSVLVVQSGRADQLPQLVERLRSEIPAAAITVLVREPDQALRAHLADSAVEISRYGEVPATIRRLRPRRFDLAVVQIGVEGHGELKILPLWLHVRHLEACDAWLRRFPVRWSTLGRFLAGASGDGGTSLGEAISRLLYRAVEGPAGAALLVAAAVRLHARGLGRRLVRRVRPARSGVN